MMKNIKVIIATHKKYRMPDANIYLPVQVGSEGKRSLGYQRDNIGENISIKNNSFCELTGLYWAWKNLNCDYLGLAHYRRYFSLRKKNDKWASVLTSMEAQELCSKYDVILTKKRRYYIETLYSHYEHTHYKEHLDITRKIISKKFPDYLNSFDKSIKQRSGYMFNMYIMKKNLSDEYCAWLFDILFELEKQIKMPELTLFQGRFYGRVSEIIFNVWLNYQIESRAILLKRIKEISCIHMESINWRKKGMAFLMAKFANKKYDGSF